MKCLTPLLVLAAATLSRAAFALPEDSGPFGVDTLTRTETVAGASLTFDLYVPKGLSAPAPIIAVGHGFQRTKANMAEWGDELARRGFVAAVPTFPGALPDHPLNGKILSGLLAWMETEAQKAGSPLAGKVDGTRRAVAGFSAGGLAAILAAAGDSSIDVVVGLDPVDNNSQGLNVAASIQAPVIFVRAEPHQCNENGNAAAMFAKLTAPRMSLKVTDATHCDGEAPSGALCSLFCGAQVRARHLLFRRYAFAALDYLLRCDTAMLPWLGGAQAQADTGIKELSVTAFPPAPVGCAASPDGGPTPDAAPPTDQGAVGDGGSLADGAPADSTPPATDLQGPGADPSIGSDDDGCGCRLDAEHSARPPSMVLLLFLAAALLLARRAG